MQFLAYLLFVSQSTCVGNLCLNAFVCSSLFQEYLLGRQFPSLSKFSIVMEIVTAFSVIIERTQENILTLTFWNNFVPQSSRKHPWTKLWLKHLQLISRMRIKMYNCGLTHANSLSKSLCSWMINHTGPVQFKFPEQPPSLVRKMLSSLSLLSFFTPNTYMGFPSLCILLLMVLVIGLRSWTINSRHDPSTAWWTACKWVLSRFC